MLKYLNRNKKLTSFFYTSNTCKPTIIYTADHLIKTKGYSHLNQLI